MAHHEAHRAGGLAAPNSSDTIAALATAPGRGGVGIVRVSGPLTLAIARAILGRLPKPRWAAHRLFLDRHGEALDEGIALLFRAPHSFTGEDVLELQGHGGPVVLDMLLRRTLELGARPARPGEFTERAFLNGKLDLAQAEAIADLVASTSEEAARLALRAMGGEFSRRVAGLSEQVVRLRAYVEAMLDFPDDEIDPLDEKKLGGEVRGLLTQLRGIEAGAREGAMLREGVSLVIAGPPNAGKSTLLNAMARRETAIVTDVPGTTRDVLRELIHIDGLPVHVLDTAGLRSSEDPVEREGIRRAWDAVRAADHVLLVIEDEVGVTEEQRAFRGQLAETMAMTVVRNKIDRTGRPSSCRIGDLGMEVSISAKHECGLDLLRDHLKKALHYRGTGEGMFMARRRHLDALMRAAEGLIAAAFEATSGGGLELVAENLRLAQQSLGEISGEVASEELLERIFSEFCIGK